MMFSHVTNYQSKMFNLSRFDNSIVSIQKNRVACKNYTSACFLAHRCRLASILRRNALLLFLFLKYDVCQDGQHFPLHIRFHIQFTCDIPILRHASYTKGLTVSYLTEMEGAKVSITTNTCQPP